MTLLHADTLLLFFPYTCAGWGVLKRERNTRVFPGDVIQLNASPLYCVDNSVDTRHIDVTRNLQTTRRRTCSRTAHYWPSYVRNTCVFDGVRSQGHTIYQFCLRESPTVTIKMSENEQTRKLQEQITQGPIDKYTGLYKVLQIWPRLICV